METNRLMRLQVTLLVALVASALVLIGVLCAPASAKHPTEVGGDECTAELEGTVTTILPDMERWRCEYDPELDDYFWVPRPPTVRPGEDAVAYKTVNFATNDGRVYHTTSRIEWIDNVLYGGTDLYLRKPITSPLTLAADRFGIRTQVWSNDGTTWSLCKDSGWLNNTVKSDHISKTRNWGTAPCGWRWYAAVDYVEYFNVNQNKWIALNGGHIIADTSDGGVNLGAAQSGQVWDARPGVPPQFPPASEEKLKEKLKKVKPAPSPPTTHGSG